ncbi:MAG: nucleotide exchange factor GrpE [Burkholderiaceae bacterium]
MNNQNNGKVEPFIGGNEQPDNEPGFLDSLGKSPAEAQASAPEPASAAEPAGQGADDASVELAQLTGELTQARAELAEAQERHVRAAAEMENVRRRAAEDVSKAHKFSIESFAESLIPVVDSLEMALKVESPTVESLKEGTEATLRQLMSSFEKNKLVAIEPAGEKFDPNLHQAISMVPPDAVNPPLPANHVATVLQKGYLINDRVLRPALVTVVQG